MKRLKRLYKNHTSILVRDGLKHIGNGEVVPRYRWKKLSDQPSLKQFIRDLSNKELSDNGIGYLSPKAARLRGWL
jgi:hypothetical protein